MSEEKTVVNSDPFNSFVGEEEVEVVETQPVVETKPEVNATVKPNVQAQEVASSLNITTAIKEAKTTRNEIVGPRIQLNPESMQKAKAIAAQINLNDSLSIQNIDKDIHGKLSGFNKDVLSRAKMSSMGDMAPMIGQILQQAKGLNPNKIRESRGIIASLLNRGKGKLSQVKSQFETAEKQFDIIEQKLNSDIERLEQDVHVLGNLQDINREQYRDLEVLIVAVSGSLYKAQEEMLPEIIERANRSDATTGDITDLMNIQRSIQHLGKKLSDLNELRMDTMQTAQVVRTMQENALNLIEHNKGAVNGAIEQWKKGCTIALMLDQQKEAAELGRAVKDMTNEMRKRNADALKETAVIIAENNERGAIDYATLEHANNQLIATMDAIQQVHINAEARRKEESVKLIELEEKLKKSVISYNTPKGLGQAHYNKQLH